MATVKLVKVNKVYEGGVHAVHDFSIDIKDKEFIANCFIFQIGENYRSAFKSSGPILVSRLKTNSKLTGDVYSWANKVGEIRKADVVS